MRLVLEGEGGITSTLAVNLKATDMNVVVVTASPESMHDALDKFQLQYLEGSIADQAILSQLKLTHDDVYIAMEQSSLHNLALCTIASQAGVNRTIARVSNNNVAELTSAHSSMFPVTQILQPEQTIASELIGAIRLPGTLRVIEFHDQAILLVGIRAEEDTEFVGKTLAEVQQILHPDTVRMVQLVKESTQYAIPTGRSTVEAGDDIYFVCAEGSLERNSVLATRIVEGYRKARPRQKSVMIAGGGAVGFALCQALERTHRVKLIESDAKLCKRLAEELNEAIVLHGSVADRDMLHNEFVQDQDVFVAVTNDDEANFLAALMAKLAGAKYTIALINNEAYLGLVEGQGIDMVVTPAHVTMSTVLSYVHSALSRIIPLRRGACSAMEVRVGRKSEANNLTLAQIQLIKPDIVIGAIVRGGKTVLAHDKLRLRTDDEVVLFDHTRSNMLEIGQFFFGSIRS